MKIALQMTITIALCWTLLLAAGEAIQEQQPDHPRYPVTINTDLVVTWAQITSRSDGTPVTAFFT